MFLAALGIAHGAGIDMSALLKFRAKYNFGPALGQVDTAYGQVTKIPGKVEHRYTNAADTTQGWMFDWPHLSAYANSFTTFDITSGSDQQAEYVNLGAMAFLGPAVGVYNTDGVTAYNTMRTAMDSELTLTNRFNGSLNTGSTSMDSPKWDILPWPATAAPTQVGVAPNPPSNVSVVIQ
jgi:hypothetical protein